MKTQILRIALFLALSLLTTLNNNASKLEIVKVQNSSISIEVNALAADINGIINEQSNHNDPDIHFHIFDLDKDDRILKIWKIKTRTFTAACYYLIFLTGLHYALFILPFVINNH